MADEYVAPEVYNDGLNSVKNGTGMELRLVDGYVSGWTLGQVQSATLATASLSAGEMIIEDAGNGRRLRIAGGKSLGNATNASGPTPDLCWAVVDATMIHFVADSTSSEQITTGNPITMSSDTLLPGTRV